MTTTKNMIEKPVLEIGELARFEEEFAVFLASHGLHMCCQCTAEYIGVDLIDNDEGDHGLARIRVAALLLDCVPIEHMGSVRVKKGVKLSPEAVWANITALSLGEVTGQRGPQIQTRCTEFQLSDADAAGDPLQPMSDAGINRTLDSANEIMALAASFSNACKAAKITNEFPVTERMMIAKIKALVVATDERFRAYLKSWREISKLAVLRTVLLEDAREVRGASGPAGPQSRTFVTTDPMTQMMASMAALQAEVAAMNKNRGSNGYQRGGGGGGGAATKMRHPYSVLQNAEQAPDKISNWQWCAHHKAWSTSHGTDTCERQSLPSQ